MKFNIPFNRLRFEGLVRPGPTQVRYGWIAWTLGEPGKSVRFLAQAWEKCSLFGPGRRDPTVKENPTVKGKMS